MAFKKSERLLIFIVAYHAEKTIDWVLKRIPEEVFEDYDTQVLIVDDASRDETYQRAIQYKNQHDKTPIVVLRNEYNQGYGGNQKVGYCYALKENFDFVALLHGDGQYAPEELPNLLNFFRDNAVDAVIGSRMMERWRALRGGMPLYKYVGNRILTTLQNWMLRSSLSEFHSGYRIYRTRALKQIPFALNTNDFHFDTEILIQLINAKSKIVEVPIPTYYGDEICYVNGMKYALDVLVTTFKNVLHGAGILYQRRFDTLPADNQHYDLKLNFRSSHTLAMEAIRENSRVLDIGGGQGYFANLLHKRKNCEVTVMDQFEPEQQDPDVNFIVHSLESDFEFSLDEYDYILLLDILEHLKSPEAFLENLRQRFTYKPKTVIITTPNIAFFIQRIMLLLGQFNYGKAGILDLTHTRLFTFRSLKSLLLDSGLKIKKISGIPAPFPKAIGDNWLSRSMISLNQMLIRISARLFSYQIFVIAETTPALNFVLENTLRISDQRMSVMDDSEKAFIAKKATLHR